MDNINRIIRRFDFKKFFFALVFVMFSIPSFTGAATLTREFNDPANNGTNANTFIVPEGVTIITIAGSGGGGGGGRGGNGIEAPQANWDGGGGGGGGSGAKAYGKILTVVPGEVLTIAVGNGGGIAGSGGVTSISSTAPLLSLSGGGGGKSGLNGFSSFPGGVAGVGGNGGISGGIAGLPGGTFDVGGYRIGTNGGAGGVPDGGLAGDGGRVGFGCSNGGVGGAGTKGGGGGGGGGGCGRIRANGGSGGLGGNGFLSVTWTEPSGTVYVLSDKATSWTILAPGDQDPDFPSINGTGSSKTYSNQPIGVYTITWDPIPGFITPTSTSKTLINGGTIKFSAVYAALIPTGTLSASPESCTIPAGSPGCESVISWTVSNVLNGSIMIGGRLLFSGIDADGSEATGNIITPPESTIKLWSGPGGTGKLLSTLTVKASREEVVCSEGYIWTGNTCVFDTTGGGGESGGSGSGGGGTSNYCSTGYMWTGSRCVADTTATGGSGGGGTSNYCSTGYTWNGSRCVVDTTTAGGGTTSTSCSAGYVWDGIRCAVSTVSGSTNSGSTAISCSTGYVWNGSKCVSSTAVTSTTVKPDIIADTVTPVIATAGTALPFYATIRNIGKASTGSSFPVFFEVATALNGNGSVADLPHSIMADIATNGKRVASSPFYTFPTGGVYSVRVCADKSSSDGSSGTVAESNESNNCGLWTKVNVAAAPVYSCTGTTPANTTMYTDDDIGLVADTAKAYSEMSTRAKCEYFCNPGYAWNGRACAASTQSDLTAGPATTTASTLVAGTRTSFSATIVNVGAVATGASFSNFFQVSTEPEGKGIITDIPSTSMTDLAAKVSRVTSTPFYTFQKGGTYSVRVCADKSSAESLGTISESNEGNNCGSWTEVKVSAPGTTYSCSAGYAWDGSRCVMDATNTKPNLTASPVTPVTAVPGTPVSFSATIKNTGAVSTGSSFPNFFQVATAAEGGGIITDLTSTNMTVVATKENMVAVSPQYTIQREGSYYVRACADKSSSDDFGPVEESNEGNNCGSWTRVTVSKTLK